MKKFMMLLVAMMLVVGFTGQAMAAFEEGHLIRVVYSGTGAGFEYATDLGDFSNLTAPISGPNAIAGQEAFTLGNISATATWNNTQVAYFIYTGSLAFGSDGAWTSGEEVGGGKVNIGQFTGPYAGVSAVTQYSWMGMTATNSVRIAQADFVSYWQQQNQAASGAAYPGSMGGYLQTSAEKNLADLSTVGYVDQVLYYYGANPDNATQGVQVAKIRTFADGHTALGTVAATPIPAAAYLFGSGLLGLVGLRRKISA